MSQDVICQAVYEVVDEFNRQNPGRARLKADIKAPLFGGKSGLDSIGLVNFIVAVEEKLEDRFGEVISLADERAMSQERSPFLTLGSFIDYIGTVFKP